MNFKKYKKSIYICAGLVGIGIIVFFYGSHLINDNDSILLTPDTNSVSDEVQSREINQTELDKTKQTKANQSNYSQVSDESRQRDISNSEDDKINKSRSSLEDDWCVPSEQLSDKNKLFLAAIQQDWNEAQGVAYANMPDVGYGDEIYDLSSAYITPYLEMDIHKLESLALRGEKWPMIAYLQRAKALSRRPIERKVANELLVSGATYHAIEFLVKDELVQAKSSYRKTKKIENSKKHLVNAVAYTMLGLQNYNTSALTAYVGNVSRDEMLSTILNPSLILNESDDEITERFAEITKELHLAREANNIYLPETPDEIKKLFALDLAHYEFKQKHIMGQLQGWQDITVGALGVAKCTGEHLVRMAKIHEQRIE
ncbi:hypothetical protein [Alteromonas gilva]|uniref:Uncharacterized protein n=1 Tax=Alteromonas gilva TaxID=2987522 RepID=A0ABT5L365_9ALTE|nr:hypothetical protein [Alteromonas gilva]MDC8831302.1 hypothetical protein [Alteromonas gilva]